MFSLLIKQPLNRWRQMGFGQRLQLSLLGLIVFFFLMSEISKWFSSLAQPPFILGLLISHLFLLFSVLSAPFIFKYALPRNKTFHLFYTLPLSRTQGFQLLSWFYHLFQIPLILLLLIAVFALFPLNFLAGLLALTFSVLYDFLILTTAGRIYARNSGGKAIHFEKIFPLTFRPIQKNNVRNSAFQKPGQLRLLITKEFLSLWRNPNYRRLKIITWFFYMIVLTGLYFSGIPDKDMWMMFFSAVLFWLHYNVHFNSKYVSPAPDWYFRTLPLPFYRVWLSKFSTEILFVLFLLLWQLIFLTLAGAPVWIQINWIGALLLFAVMVLSVVINFQILFYDNPRLAGYAYHFTILFIVIMSFNYRLVGPLTSVFLLTFYFFKTWRFYNS